jgi:hypothetical protein
VNIRLGEINVSKFLQEIAGKGKSESFDLMIQNPTSRKVQSTSLVPELFGRLG